MSEIAIRINDVSKQYRLGQYGSSTLQADLQSFWAKVTHKDDPNTKIGSSQIKGDRFLALDHISLDIYKGETIGIIGRNGAGKSTLLKLISSITAPTSGEIELFGRVSSMLEVGTGFHREMTGRENIYLNGAILGMTKQEIDHKIEDIIDFSEVREFIDTPVKRYSSGMYVKLAFSVAAHLDSEIMIMDEVLAVGDMAFQKKCLERMRQEASVKGKTVIYVSHNMGTIQQLCDRCAVLDKGRLVFVGDTSAAIAFYMGIDQELDMEIDLDSIPRKGKTWQSTTKLLYAKFLNTSSPDYRNTDSIDLELHWMNNCNGKTVNLRIEIWSFDDAPICTFVINDLLCNPLGDVSRYRILVPLTDFTEGRYRMKYSLFYADPFGNKKNTDSVEGLRFSIQKKPNDLEWDTAHWGYLNMPGATAERIE